MRAMAGAAQSLVGRAGRDMLRGEGVHRTRDRSDGPCWTAAPGPRKKGHRWSPHRLQYTPVIGFSFEKVSLLICGDTPYHLPFFDSILHFDFRHSLRKETIRFAMYARCLSFMALLCNLNTLVYSDTTTTEKILRRLKKKKSASASPVLVRWTASPMKPKCSSWLAPQAGSHVLLCSGYGSAHEKGCSAGGSRSLLRRHAPPRKSPPRARRGRSGRDASTCGGTASSSCSPAVGGASDGGFG